MHSIAQRRMAPAPHGARMRMHEAGVSSEQSLSDSAVWRQHHMVHAPSGASTKRCAKVNARNWVSDGHASCGPCIRMPDGLYCLLESFCAEVEVCFHSEGTYDEQGWVRRWTGLLQGCALSAMVLAVLMAVWCHDLNKHVPQAQAYCSFDERIITATH